MIANNPDEAAWDAAILRHDEALERLGRDAQAAEAIARAACSDLEATIGADHPDTLNVRATVGLAILLQGRFAEALAALAPVVDALEAWQHEPVVMPMRVRARVLLGDALRQGGQYERAAAHLRDAARDADAHLPEDDELIGHVWNALGIALRFAGDYDAAAAAYGRFGQWLDVHQPGDHPDRATLHHNLSGLAHARGDYATSLVEAGLARALRERILAGAADGPLGQDIAAEGTALEGLGRIDEALERYDRALAIYRATLPPDHPEVAYLLHNRGDALVSAKRHDEAIACYQEALALKQQLFGPVHAEVAATRGNLAVALAEAGRPEEADKAAHEAREIARAALPETHPWRANLESLAVALGSPPRA